MLSTNLESTPKPFLEDCLVLDSVIHLWFALFEGCVALCCVLGILLCVALCCVLGMLCVALVVCCMLCTTRTSRYEALQKNCKLELVLLLLPYYYCTTTMCVFCRWQVAMCAQVESDIYLPTNLPTYLFRCWILSLFRFFQVARLVTMCTLLTLLSLTNLLTYLTYSTLLYSTLLYSTLLYSTLLYSTLLYSTLL
jgi:hypothetical protein